MGDIIYTETEKQIRLLIGVASSDMTVAQEVVDCEDDLECIEGVYQSIGVNSPTQGAKAWVVDNASDIKTLVDTFGLLKGKLPGDPRPYWG